MTPFARGIKNFQDLKKIALRVMLGKSQSMFSRNVRY